MLFFYHWKCSYLSSYVTASDLLFLTCWFENMSCNELGCRVLSLKWFWGSGGAVKLGGASDKLHQCDYILQPLVQRLWMASWKELFTFRFIELWWWEAHDYTQYMLIIKGLWLCSRSPKLLLEGKLSCQYFPSFQLILRHSHYTRWIDVLLSDAPCPLSCKLLFQPFL